MIRYDLVCENGHDFDGWFRDSEAFDALSAAGAVGCPVCDATKVAKTLMTPGVPAKANRASVPAGLQDDKAKAMRQAFQKLREHVTENADYVGSDFPEEARKIHYKEADKRGIYGEATIDEARSLHEEGIDVLPLPPAPKERN